MYSIAIDGPAGAGKSSLAKQLSKELGFIYIDTGAMYRTAAIWAIQNGISTNDEAKINERIDEINIDISYVDGEQHVFLNGDDVTSLIRTPEVSIGASNIAVIGSVRVKMVELQRKMAEKTNVVMDGRDIGTVVLPNATLKIFLEASAEERAKRRHEELLHNGIIGTSYSDVLEDIKKRDYQDSHRAISPLKKADDAVAFDNTNINLFDTYKGIRNIVKDRLNI